MKRNHIVALVLIVSIVLLIFSIPYLSRALHRDDWKTKTSPLPKQTISLLCERFGLSSQDRLCKDNRDVYGTDFFPVIRSTFQSELVPDTGSNKAASFDAVEQKLGTFRYECEPTVHQADGYSYFVCYYDLRGDRAFVVAIVYSYPEKKVLRINGTSLYDE
jgi:hypothetical protein